MEKDVRHTFWEAFADSPFIMMKLEGSNGHSEPMTAQLDKDAHHTIWFFTDVKNRIAAGGRAMGQVMTKGHDVFACIAGKLTRETDRTIWDKHWNNAVEAWFPNGRENPEVIMLRFDIDDSEVWTSEPGVTGSLKMMAGMKITPEEAGEHEVGRV